MNARGLEQARHVFLRGCGLPGAWAAQPQWRILETGFGLGLNFLASWLAWKQDPQRPRLLHYVSIEASPITGENLLRDIAAHPELLPLAEALAAQWSDLLPGVHRLVFEQGHVLLTLHVRSVREALRKEPFTADSVFLGSQAWDLHSLKALARHCRRGSRIAGEPFTSDMRQHLAQCGFSLQQDNEGLFSPAWEPKARRPETAIAPAHCAVIGSGLAGASVAASLARRGWQVTVIDAADHPAAAASGLPAGLLAPHHSPDDNQLSRLSRCGVRLTLQQAKALLHEEDWQLSGVIEKRPEGDLWHEQAAWIKPVALVRAWLSQPGIEWRGNTRVARIERADDQWRLWDEEGKDVGRMALVVVAAAHDSAPLLGNVLPLSPVRGQVSWNFHEAGFELSAHPLNGNGHFLPAVPWQGHTAWLTGSTYGRDEISLEVRDADHQANFDRLQALAPDVARQLAPQFQARKVQAWTGVRCASADRRPLLGEVQPGLWVSTAMGSRGLTFAVLCAELLAARLHGEPLPMEHKLARALDTARVRPG
jgi:tRNA 5-methylaminomethyl-2-thiouridine biosynthesis bifunctional protein